MTFCIEQWHTGYSCSPENVHTNVAFVRFFWFQVRSTCSTDRRTDSRTGDTRNAAYWNVCIINSDNNILTGKYYSCGKTQRWQRRSLVYVALLLHLN